MAGLAGLLELPCIFPFQEAINFWQGEKKAASRDLPIEEEEGGEAISSEGDTGSLAHKGFDKALHGWSWVLKDSGKSPPHCGASA